jgi:hypothetical protein
MSASSGRSATRGSLVAPSLLPALAAHTPGCSKQAALPRKASPVPAVGVAGAGDGTPDPDITGRVPLPRGAFPRSK